MSPNRNCEQLLMVAPLACRSGAIYVGTLLCACTCNIVHAREKWIEQTQPSLSRMDVPTMRTQHQLTLLSFFTEAWYRVSLTSHIPPPPTSQEQLGQYWHKTNPPSYRYSVINVGQSKVVSLQNVQVAKHLIQQSIPVAVFLQQQSRDGTR